MNFFLDHGVPRQIAEMLVRHGHKATPLAAELPATSPDRDVFLHAIRTDRILITCNRDDFLALAQTAGHPGLIILIRRHSSVSEQGHLLGLLAAAGEEGLAGNINFA